MRNCAGRFRGNAETYPALVLAYDSCGGGPGQT